MKSVLSVKEETTFRTMGSLKAAYRRGFSRGLAFGLILLAVLIVLTGGLLYGQGSVDALFIDEKGTVKIQELEVKGATNLSDDLTVDGSTTLGKALTVQGATTLKNNLTVSGNLGIGTTDPAAKLEVAGNTQLNGSVGINRSPIDNQHLVIQPTDDHIALKVTDPSGTDNWFTVTAGGNVIMNGGNVGIGTASPAAKLEVVGDARIKGKVTRHARYQRDDEIKGFYEISPRYHLSLTGVKYGGRTKTIPQDTLEALCADYDGCEVRLAMTRWASDTNTESASAFFTFYYSAGNGRWRASATDAGNAAGVDGDGKTKHVRNIWSTCFFTDGTYNQYKDLGDKGPGLQLLVWKEFKNKNRTCELTLID